MSLEETKLELIEHVRQNCKDENITDLSIIEEIVREKEKIINENLNHTLGIP